MKLFTMAIIGCGLASEAYCTVIPLANEVPSTIHKRANGITINNLPLKAPLCSGFSVSVTNIDLATTQGINSTVFNLPKGNGDYPHEFGNYPENFSFANCPTGSGTILEYPVLRLRSNPWVPAKNTRLPSTEPDRVIYQYIDATHGNFCGMITHPPGDNKGFVQCT